MNKDACRTENGWKQEDNKRFGQCLEVRFIDVTTNKIMFRYAPLLEDKKFWDDMFKKLETYDSLHKAIFRFVQEIDGERFNTFSDCTRIKEETQCQEKLKY